MKVVTSLIFLYFSVSGDAQRTFNYGGKKYLVQNENGYTTLVNPDTNVYFQNDNYQQQNVYEKYNTVKPQLHERFQTQSSSQVPHENSYQKPQGVHDDRFQKPQVINDERHQKPQTNNRYDAQQGLNDERYQKPQRVNDERYQTQGYNDERYQSTTEIKLLGPGTTEVEQLNNITFAITNFAVNLMKSISSLQQGNIIISPTSVTTILALLQQGTYGESQQQITEALQLSPDITAPTYKRLTKDMQKRVSRNILTVANNIYLGEGFDLNEEFKLTATKNFGSEVSLLNSHQPALAVRQINKWVASKTNNKILNLLTEDSINPNTQIVIVNAVYFKGLWETKFKPDATKDMDFHLSNGRTIQVPFMRMTTDLKYGVDKDLDSCITILPFERSQYSLIIILPNEGTSVNDVLHSVTNTKLVDYHKFQESEVRIELPKFTMKSDTDLIPVLRKMGVVAIFDDETDLSGIGTYRTFSPHISSALHTGFMSVDEQGVSASAASSFAGVALSFDPTSVNFEVNRPFVAVLWDTQFAIPLFIARIEEPRV